MQDFATLTEDEAGDALVNLVVQLGDAQMEEEAAHRRVVGLRKVIDGLVEMFPAIEDFLPEDLGDDEPPRPRGASAAFQVLHRRADKWYPVPTIVSFLDQNGWLPQSSNPANAVRTALERLVKANQIHKSRSTDGDVIYSYQSPAPNYDDDDYGEDPF